MFKELVLIGAIVLSGCASKSPVAPTPGLPYHMMDNFKADCLHAKYQMQFLEDKIAEYQQYHQTRPYTNADHVYHRKLKNALWGLRSSCVVK